MEKYKDNSDKKFEKLKEVTEKIKAYSAELWNRHEHLEEIARSEPTICSKAHMYAKAEEARSISFEVDSLATELELAVKKITD